MITPQISLSVNDDGSILSIRDITSYGDPLKENVALIAGWSKDAFVADINVDFTNPDPGLWEEMISNGYTYNVFMYACHVYSATLDADLIQKTIVYDRGNFYVKITNGTINPSTSIVDLLFPADDKSVWALLKVGTVFTFEGGVEETLDIARIYELINEAGQLIGVVTSIINVNATTCFLEKLYCHSWRVRNNSPVPIVSVNLLDYKRTILVSYEGSEEVAIDLEPYGDGFFIVQVIYDDTFVEYAILDFCDAYTCYEGLFKHSLCGSDDPCSANSDCDGANSVANQDMNSIREIITTLTMMAKFNLSQQMGIFGVVDNYEDFIITVGMLINKLKVITDRCGICNDETLNTDC